PHPEALPLVEAQVTDVRGRGRDQNRRHGLGCREVDGGLDEPAPYPVPLPGLADGHVLDLNLPRVTGAGQLEVADDLAVRGGHQDAADVDVGVELRGGVLSQLEQRAQVVPWPAVGLDADVVGRTGGHHVSLTGSAATLTLEPPDAVGDLADQAELVLLGVLADLVARSGRGEPALPNSTSLRSRPDPPPNGRGPEPRSGARPAGRRPAR